MGIASSQMLVNTRQNLKHRKLAYRERSHVFSYFIGVAVLMSNVAGFVGFCETNCNEYFVFPNDRLILGEFASYFTSAYSSDVLLDHFDCIETTVERNTRARGRLRMSLIELD